MKTTIQIASKVPPDLKDEFNDFLAKRGLNGVQTGVGHAAAMLMLMATESDEFDRWIEAANARFRRHNLEAGGARRVARKSLGAGPESGGERKHRQGS